MKARDCLPLNIGVHGQGGIMKVAIARGTKIPAESTLNCSTSFDN